MAGFLTPLLTAAVYTGRDKPLLELERKDPQSLIEAALTELSDLPPDVTFATLRYLVTIVKRTNLSTEVYRQFFKSLVEDRWLALRGETETDVLVMTAYCDLAGQVSRRAQLQAEEYLHLVALLSTGLVQLLGRGGGAGAGAGPAQNDGLKVSCFSRVLRELFTRRLPAYRSTQRRVLNAVLEDHSTVVTRYVEQFWAQQHLAADSTTASATGALPFREFKSMVQAMVLSPVFPDPTAPNVPVEVFAASLDASGLCTAVLHGGAALEPVVACALAQAAEWPIAAQYSVLLSLAAAQPATFEQLVAQGAPPTASLQPLVAEVRAHTLPALCESLEDHIAHSCARAVDVALETAGDAGDAWTVADGVAVVLLGRSRLVARELAQFNDSVINALLATHVADLTVEKSSS
ncbi:hypothetical protein GNI_113240 [Gregarina niphandrodes]|uniref:Uncharacterized protein n=1 Tax=Gregarina niphandrodes TaxID=110365 RepID=A0A023B3A2_GRENI|nr:hypothetical protein GNI_113240 [Gregarina niphandrodes]EZG55425.1 hypothetical protein GNI_113240 [Gregarina niphandrodes]|eukprot:XP_011131565.1 hypothetical protein GNI_113240 [Gregarina niphandrodes]